MISSLVSLLGSFSSNDKLNWLIKVLTSHAVVFRGDGGGGGGVQFDLPLKTTAWEDIKVLATSYSDFHFALCLQRSHAVCVNFSATHPGSFLFLPVVPFKNYCNYAQ